MPAGGTRRATTGSHARPSGSGGVVRGMLALVLLLAMVVGIPVVLLAVGSMSYLDEFADLPRLIGNLTSPDDGSLLLGVLTLVAWIGWATFALAVLLEIPAQLRGVPAVRLRGIRIQQSVAGSLVAAALTVVALPAAASAAEPSTRKPVTAPTTAEISAPRQVPAVAHSSDARQAGHGEPSAGPQAVTYEVRRGDTLWDIAAEHLGDGSQWRRIAHLNYDRVQPDGGRLDRSHRLQPGWRLVLPEPSAQGRHDAGARVHVVKPGETLSAIAREELGSGDRWPEILDATTSVVEPGGARLTDPDRIYPGWTVRLPSDEAPVEPTGGTSSASAPTRSDPAAARGTVDALHGERPDPSSTPRPSSSQRAEGSRSTPSGAPPSTALTGQASVAPYPEGRRPRRTRAMTMNPCSQTSSMSGPWVAWAGSSPRASCCSSAPDALVSNAGANRASGSPCLRRPSSRRRHDCDPSRTSPASGTSTWPCVPSRPSTAPGVARCPG